MTRSSASAPGAGQEAKLPLRDWILLPLLGLSTICVLLISTEIIARKIFPSSASSEYDCMITNSPSTGYRAIPNSVCWERLPESEMTEYRFNSCGHRAGEECGPKPPGSYRIVMVGASTAMGYRMSWEKTIAALLPSQISALAGRKIDLYNESLVMEFPHVVNLRTDEFLAAKPDMILWLISPYDIDTETTDLEWRNPDENSGSLAKAWTRAKYISSNRSFPDVAEYLWQHLLGKLSRFTAITFIKHLLFESRSQYVKSSLLGGDNFGYLRAQYDANWQSRLRKFDSDVAEIELRAKRADVPIVAVFIPSREQLAIVSSREWPEGFEPDKLDREVCAILASHGGTCIDILPDLLRESHPELHFYLVDSHPDLSGHAIISGIIANELTGGAVPALRASGLRPVALHRER